MTNLVTDHFSRTASPGWGVADGTGDTWSSAGSPSNLSVSGGKGRLSIAVSAAQSAYLGSFSQADYEAVADFTLSANPTGSGVNFGFELRRQGVSSPTSRYLARMKVRATGSAPQLQLYYFTTTDVQIGSTVTLTGLDLGSAFTNSTVMHLRVSCTGTPTRIKLRYWKDADPEPSTWQLDITDTSNLGPQTAGQFAIHTINGSGGAQVVMVDELSVDTVTVSTSVTTDAPMLTVQAPAPNMDNGVVNTFDAYDVFNRSVVNSWGTAAPQGGNWSMISGVLTRVSVDGNSGKCALAPGGTQEMLLADVDDLNTEVSADFHLDTLPLGQNGFFVGIFARAQGPAEAFYLVRLNIRETGGLRLQGYANNVNMGGTYTSAETWSTPGTILHVKLRVTGTGTTSIQAKAWKDFDAEPNWLYTASNATTTPNLQAAGGVGVYMQNASDTGATISGFVDNFQAGPPVYEPTPPAQLTVVSPAPTVSANTNADPIFLTDFTQQAYVKAKIAAGSNQWASYWSYIQNLNGGPGTASPSSPRQSQNVGAKSGLSTAQRLYYSNSYLFTPSPSLDTDAKYQNWSDDAYAAYTLALKGFMESSNTAYDAAIAGIMAWIDPAVNANAVTFMSSLPTNGARGKLWIAWAGCPFIQAWGLCLQSGRVTTAQKAKMQQWIVDVPLKGNANPTSFTPNGTSTTEGTLVAHPENGNWMFGHATILLYMGLTLDSVSGDTLIDYAQRLFAHSLMSNVYDPATVNNHGLGVGVPYSVNWSPVTQEATGAGGYNTKTLIWRYFWLSDVNNGHMFTGQIVDWIRDPTHCAMSLSHIGNFIETYLINGLGDPFEGSTVGLDTLAAGVETVAKTFHEILDVSWDTYNGDINQLSASTWKPTGVPYGGWAYDAAGPKVNPITGAVVNDFISGDSGRGGGSENAMFVWDYLLRYQNGYDLPYLKSYVERVRGVGQRAKNGPQAGITIPVHAYVTSHAQLTFTTDQTFQEIEETVVGAGAPGAAMAVQAPIDTVVASNPPDVSYLMTSNLVPSPSPTVAPGPVLTVDATPPPVDPPGTATLQRASFEEGAGFTATYEFDNED